jgi:antitoxin (DNA-binding transcriptional repressor) of toxin-antitoxin stability system
MGDTREVNVRELRNHGGRVLSRVAQGEAFIVTKDGTAVAELRPIGRKSLAPAELIARAKRMPKVDPDELRRDLDSVLDQAL